MSVSEALEEIEAVLAGEVQIEEHDVELALASELARFVSAVGAHHLEAGENFPRETVDELFVIDEEHAAFPVICHAFLATYEAVFDNPTR